MAGELPSPEGLEWSASKSSLPLILPLPVGWVVEPGAPSPCTGLPQASAIAAAYPARDVTLALRAAVWDAGSTAPQDAAAACNARRGATGSGSYARRAEWLGVSYSIEGVFIRLGSQRVAQLEVISPDQRVPLARALLAAWIKKAAEPGPR
jgi:hypothetical protein